MIQHIVLFTPRAGLPDADRQNFAAKTLETLRQSTDIHRLSLGRRVDIDAGYERSFGDKTYEYSAVLEFEDRQALIRYLNSPSHRELGRLFWETCESTVILEAEIIDATMANVDYLA